MNPRFADSTKVLIVDDQVLAQGYLKYSLGELGIRNVQHVDNAVSAISRISKEHFDLIMCSYNLKQDQDGYYLYDELKVRKKLPPSTAFIFVSAETSADIVHSVVELQPDDFLAKPFSLLELDKRLTRVLQRKRAMAEVYTHIEHEQLSKALEAAESLLTDPDKSEFFPLALKTKGELLLALGKTQQAHDFYAAILNVQNFTWAQLGLIDCLIRLNEDDEAEKRILRLAFRPDAQLAAYDLISALHIKQQDFDTALESAVLASEISPRNLRRHRQALDLSRITHDFATQFEVAKKIVRFAKNSMHDKAENYLNVARAGIDYALTADDEEARGLIRQANSYVKQAQSQFPRNTLVDQVTVINARILQLQNEHEKAQALIEELTNEDLSQYSLEDLLDKAKAYHELGLYNRALALLAEIEQRCQFDDSQGKLFATFIKQQRSERDQIRQTPRELNNDAVQHYQKGDFANALEKFRQAFMVMPKNPAISLNLLQTLTLLNRERERPSYADKLAERCLVTIEESDLTQEQLVRYQRIRSILTEQV